jgi:hypothetical protein
VGVDVSVGVIVEVNAEVGVLGVMTGVSERVCVGRIDFGSGIIIVDGLNITSGTATPTAIVAMIRMMAKIT